MNKALQIGDGRDGERSGVSHAAEERTFPSQEGRTVNVKHAGILSHGERKF